MKHQYIWSLILGLCLISDIINAKTPTGQTRLVITVNETFIQSQSRWIITCNMTGGTHPNPHAICNEIEHLQIPVDEAIRTAQANTPCNRMLRPINLTVSGSVNSKEIKTLTKEYPNPCIMRGSLASAGLQNLVPS